jgi:TolB-like protein/Tfp pilus assembly protein PilF
MSARPSLFSELKRRNVLRAAVLYAGAVWLLAQVITQLGPVFDAPPWIARSFLIAAAIGFPLWIAFAWFYEFTPQGLKRESEIATDASITRSTGRKLDRAIIVVLAVAVVLLLTNMFVSNRRTNSNEEIASAIPGKSIAVLPFENLSTEKSNAYFADGMQDLILTRLAGIRDLKVISRTSTEKYASHPDDLRTVARQLGVATILEGSVQKAGNRVLIDVQLIDAATGAHIWAESYQRTLDDIFGVEGEVARKVAESLEVKLTRDESKAVARVPTRNKAALQAYLQAVYYMDESTRALDPGDVQRAVTLAQQATRLDPGFSDAWALQALGLLKSGHLDQAEAASRRALALNPYDEKAHVMVGFSLAAKGLHEAAIAQMREAIRLSPDAWTYGALGYEYQMQGNYEQASSALRHAIELDPKENKYREVLADLYMSHRQYAPARAVLQDAVVRDPADLSAASSLAFCDVLGWGDLDASRRALQDVPTPAAGSGALAENWYWQHLLERDYPAALQVIAEAPPARFISEHTSVALYQAQAYRAAGDAVRARAAFGQARVQLEDWLKSEPPDAADIRSQRALALAGLGENDLALREAQSVASKSPGEDIGHYFLRLANLAEVEAWIGRGDAAIKTLDELLAMPSGNVISAQWIRLDPAWDPIRRDPRFQTLLKKYADSVPAARGAEPM